MAGMAEIWTINRRLDALEFVLSIQAMHLEAAGVMTRQRMVDALDAYAETLPPADRLAVKVYAEAFKATMDAAPRLGKAAGGQIQAVT